MVLVLTEVLWAVKGHAVIWNRAVTGKLNAGHCDERYAYGEM
jgi:hypothetical protein